MTQNQFSHEAINQAVIAIKGHESDIQAMKEKCANMPLAEVAQTILIGKFGIAQIEAAEIVEDINKGIAEFDAQYRVNVSCESVKAKEKLSELTKDMTDQERVKRYANILTALQVLEKGEVAKEEAEQLLEANLKKDADVLAEEIEALLNDGINLEQLANAVQDGVNIESISEIAKQIEMNKDDYRFMTALWLYIAQREGEIKLSESEVPVPTQMLGALGSASIEAILATAELKDGKIDLKRWQVVMKWILGALFVAGLLYLLWNIMGVLTFITTFLVLEYVGTSAIAVYIALLLGLFVCWFFAGKTFEFGKHALEFLSGLYDEYIGPFTEKTKTLAKKVKEWVEHVIDAITNHSNGNSGGSGGGSPILQPEPINNNGETSGVQPVMA